MPQLQLSATTRKLGKFRWSSDMSRIKNDAETYFQNRLSSEGTNSNDNILDCIPVILNDDDNNRLKAVPDLEKSKARGKSGIKVRPECRLTVVLRELSPEEETEVARLRVSKFKKLTKRERQLMPHQLIEVTPKWHRKPKTMA
ncbi:hypothetical protein AMTRI_Chr01g134810 [Amborella trichopoda]